MTTQPPFTFPSDQDAFVRAADCARFLGIGRSTWWAWVKQGKVQRPKKLGPRTSVWTAGYVRSVQDKLATDAC
ncbi:helix-turn-helix transcriptional regulator [Microbulbifer sp. JSM ZJ756]|uniref:helix-turn-helix transcriptional regulator n=1 Tax=Microbulbifer sp. JSM ZJ756 TaxID=3376191 RepID=UPI0037B01D34